VGALAQYTIVGLGEALWDLLPSGKHLGGAPLNFAYVASLLEERSVIATRVGDDELGRELRSELAIRNLDTSAIQIDPELPTGTVDVQFQNGQPEYTIRKPAAWDAMEWSAEWQRLSRNCDAVCYGTLAQRANQSRETMMKFVANTRPECLRVFDINLRSPFYDREVIASGLKYSSVVKMNDAELPQVAAILGFTGLTPEAQMRQLGDQFGAIVLITCGERGAMAANGAQLVRHPGFRITVQDTIGAGDAFGAAATDCLLRTMSLEKTLEIANRWASWVASQVGGMPAINEDRRRELLQCTFSSA
jgi:fructokinase